MVEAKKASPGEKTSDFKPNIDELIPSDLLHEGEEVIYAVKPSLWLVVFGSFRIVVVAVVLAVITTFWGPRWHLGALGGYIILACAGLALGRVGYAFLQWLSRVYVLTNKRVIRVRGVFTIDIFQCGLPRLQNTFLTMTLAQRVLNLGNIAFTTAGTSGIEAIWRHIYRPLEAHQKLIRAVNAASNQSAGV